MLTKLGGDMNGLKYILSFLLIMFTVCLILLGGYKVVENQIIKTHLFIGE